MRKHSITILALLILIFVAIFYDEIRQAIVIMAYTVAGLVSIAFVIVLFLAGWYVVEKMRMIRANRIEAEKQAHVMVITNSGQTWIRDTDHKAYWKAGHLEQRVYSNSQHSQPSQVEALAWQIFNSPKRVISSKAELLPANVQPETLDLLQALDTVQRCLIVGASDTGKTTLLQHIITRRLQSSKVIVIDPHTYPDKWPSCTVIGKGRDYQEIDKTLTALIQIMTKRYEEIGEGVIPEMGHAKITILIDEWRAIVFNVKDAKDTIKALLTESRKAAFSVFVATHSDRAKPLGLEGEYDLRDGFSVVRLSIIDNQRQATIDTGNGEIQAIMPGPYTSSQVIEGDDYINLEPEPSPAEAHILHLYEQGESISSIATQVYGSKGGNQNQQVKDVLSKFDVA